MWKISDTTSRAKGLPGMWFETSTLAGTKTACAWPGDRVRFRLADISPKIMTATPVRRIDGENVCVRVRGLAMTRAQVMQRVGKQKKNCARTEMTLDFSKAASASCLRMRTSSCTQRPVIAQSVGGWTPRTPIRTNLLWRWLHNHAATVGAKQAQSARRPSRYNKRRSKWINAIKDLTYLSASMKTMTSHLTVHTNIWQRSNNTHIKSHSARMDPIRFLEFHKPPLRVASISANTCSHRRI